MNRFSYIENIKIMVAQEECFASCTYTAQKLHKIPVLYLSRFIMQNKSEDCKLLQETRNTGDYDPWILYMLSGIEQTSRQTIEIIKNIQTIMADYKHRIRRDLLKIYSQDLLNNLFKHPYTKIEFLQKDIRKSRITATKYLDILAQEGFVEKEKVGKYNYYMNKSWHISQMNLSEKL